MNPLHVIGLCEVRRDGTPLPQRITVAFPDCKLVDDRPRDRTRVTGEIVPTSMRGKLGLGTPPTAAVPIPGGGTEYVYDDRAGVWFGREAAFDDAEVVYIQATAGHAADVIRVQGFAPDPNLYKKALLNFGPADVVVSALDPLAGNVRAPYEIVLRPNDGCRMFWDSRDQVWRLLQRLRPFTIPTTPDGQLVIQGDPLHIQGDPLVITAAIP